MLLRRRVALITTVSAVMLGLVTVPASSADRTAPAGSETSLKPGDAYVISASKLVADPQKAADVLKKDGDLDRLDIKPSCMRQYRSVSCKDCSCPEGVSRRTPDSERE